MYAIKANKNESIEYIGVKQKIADTSLKNSIDIFKFDLGF